MAAFKLIQRGIIGAQHLGRITAAHPVFHLAPRPIQRSAILARPRQINYIGCIIFGREPKRYRIGGGGIERRLGARQPRQPVAFNVDMRRLLGRGDFYKTAQFKRRRCECLRLHLRPAGNLPRQIMPPFQRDTRAPHKQKRRSGEQKSAFCYVCISVRHQNGWPRLWFARLRAFHKGRLERFERLKTIFAWWAFAAR